jgi:uncharacterized alpha-E superfamily protein
MDRGAQVVQRLRSVSAPLCGQDYTSRVAEFLVLDRTFPRAVRFSFDQVRWALRSIAMEHGSIDERPPEIVASHVRHMLSETTMKGIVQFGLHEYMAQLQHYCAEVSNKITQTYFRARCGTQLDG